VCEITDDVIDRDDDVCVNEETVNGDACLSNNGPGSVPPRNPSQGPPPQQPNFPTSQAQVVYLLFYKLRFIVDEATAC